MNSKEPSTHPFVKLYFDDIARLYKVSKPAGNLFFELTRLIKTDPKGFPNVIFLSAKTKKLMAIAAGIAESETDPNIYNTSKYLAELVKAGLLGKIDSNTFIANPDIVSKVDWELAQKIHQIRVAITYDIVGRNILTIIEQQESEPKINPWIKNL